MGTPWFAVPSLKKLIDNSYDIVAVVTQPDRKSGRGHKLTPPPVKELAQEHSIPVLQFEKIKSDEGVAALKELNPDMIVTAAFGQILSKQILDIPKLGCINVHASILPKYRGAAPIQWAVINGEKTTGVTIMYMDVGLDTGDIISTVTTDITEDMTGGELYEKLAVLGADLLVNTLPNIEDGSAGRQKQNEEDSSYYPPLSKELGRIDWRKNAREIHNLIRALNPVMSGYTAQEDSVYKIWQTSVLEGSAPVGKVITADQKKGIIVGTGEGLISIDIIQAPNSKRMKATDFLRGKSLVSEQFN